MNVSIRNFGYELPSGLDAGALSFQDQAVRGLGSQLSQGGLPPGMTGLAGPLGIAPPHAGLCAGPIVAWRLWRIGLHGALQSLSVDVEWPAGRPLVGDPRLVDAGIHALKDRARVSHALLTTVIGQVALWGRVIEHEHGYRAEYGYPVMVDFSPPMPGFPRPASLVALADTIRQRYGCEIRV